MIELLKTLCALPGPSGCEDAVRAFVLKTAKPFADEIKTDAIGNVMVFRKGKKTLERPVAVCAHMDEVGVIVKKITEDGMLKFGFVGGVDPRVVIGKGVRFGDTRGVTGIKAVHLTTAAERRTMPKTKDLYIDIGATSRAAAEAKVSLGDYGVFDSDVVLFGDGLIKAKAIDDRIGCAVMMKLLEEELPLDTTFVFTVQEEVGLRGARTAAYGIAPDYGIAVDVTDSDDIPDAPHECSSAAGKGAAIKVMDSSVICHPAVVKTLEDLAQARNIPYQRDILRFGGTDAGAIHQSRSGVYTGGISVATRYVHTPMEVADLDDIEACVALTAAFAQAKLEA